MQFVQFANPPVKIRNRCRQMRFRGQAESRFARCFGSDIKLLVGLILVTNVDGEGATALEDSGEASLPSMFPSAAGYEEDDEASLYKLGGFALFSCIRFRQRKLMWRKKVQIRKETAQRYRTEHALLQQLRDTEKCDLPVAIYIQDRGGMTFMNPCLVPFIRESVAEIRKLLNYQEYSKHGKNLFKVLVVIFLRPPKSKTLQ